MFLIPITVLSMLFNHLHAYFYIHTIHNSVILKYLTIYSYYLIKTTILVYYF